MPEMQRTSPGRFFTITCKQRTIARQLRSTLITTALISGASTGEAQSTPAAITCRVIGRSANQVPWNSGLLLPGGRFISNMFSVLTSR
jgi:hypothetical protein